MTLIQQVKKKIWNMLKVKCHVTQCEQSVLLGPTPLLTEHWMLLYEQTRGNCYIFKSFVYQYGALYSPVHHINEIK